MFVGFYNPRNIFLEAAKPMKNVLITALTAFCSAIGGVLVYSYFVINTPVVYQVNQSAIPTTKVAFNNTISNRNEDGFLSFTDAVHKSMPTVVHINVIRSTEDSQYLPVQNGHSNSLELEPGDKAKESISASGVIVTRDGHIATNAHVVANAEIIEVSLSDKTSYFAELLALDINTDLAILKIGKKNLPVIEFANSDMTDIGQWVLAVGNPFGLSSTVTAGIISGKGRDLNLADQKIESFIQSDAAVNQGNSGGALVNTDGRLIGINSVIATSSGNFEGYSFAIPSNIVQKVINDLLEHGYVRRPYLGMEIRDLNYKEDKDVDNYEGVRIVKIESNTVAKKSGLKVGDIIKKISGYTIRDENELRARISHLKPGAEVSVTYQRNGQRSFTRLKLRNVQTSTINRKIEDLLGARVVQTSLNELKSYNLNNGVKIVSISKGLLYSNTNLKRNYIITHINNEPIFSVEQLHDILFKIENGKAVTVTARNITKKKDEFFSFGMQRQ